MSEHGQTEDPGAPPSDAAAEDEPPPPLLEAIDARIAVGGASELDELTLQTRGGRVLLAGDAAPLLAALFGVAPDGREPTTEDGAVASPAEVVAGSLRLRGLVPGSADYHAAVGLAPLDPPLPSRWTLGLYLEWAARLGGARRRQARALATATMRRLGLEAGRSRRLGTLGPAERRAAVLAQAVVGGPRALVAEAPLSRLDGPSAEWLAQVLHQASDGVDTVVSVAQLGSPRAESRLVGQATDVCYFRQGRLLAHRTAAELMASSSWLEVCVAGAVDGLERELSADGIELRGGPACYLAFVPTSEGSRETAATSPASRILAAAARAKAPVVRCAPVL